MSKLFEIELVIAFFGGFAFGFTIIIEIIKDIFSFISKKIHTKKFSLTNLQYDKALCYIGTGSRTYYAHKFWNDFLKENQIWSSVTLNKIKKTISIVWRKPSKSDKEYLKTMEDEKNRIEGLMKSLEKKKVKKSPKKNVAKKS